MIENTNTHTYIYILCIYIYMHFIYIIIYIYISMYIYSLFNMCTCCLGPHFCRLAKLRLQLHRRSTTTLAIQRVQSMDLSMNGVLQLFYKQMMKYKLQTHPDTCTYISYILYIIFDFRCIYIYIYFSYIHIYIIYIIFQYTYTYFCIYVILYLSMFFWAQCVRSFFMTLNSINPKMVWSSNHRCSIVVVSLRCGSLCLSTLASARLEYQFFTFESYDLSISSFVTTFQCENTREGTMSCAFRLELVVEHFHQ